MNSMYVCRSGSSNNNIVARRLSSIFLILVGVPSYGVEGLLIL